MHDQSISSRRRFCRWAGWFFVANTFLFFLIGLNYLFYLPDFDHIPLMTTTGVILGWVFMLTGLLGQSGLFALIVLIPFILLRMRDMALSLHLLVEFIWAD